MYPKDFIQLPFNKTFYNDKNWYNKWVSETGYIIPIPLIYGLIKEKVDKVFAHM